MSDPFSQDSTSLPRYWAFEAFLRFIEHGTRVDEFIHLSRNSISLIAKLPEIAFTVAQATAPAAAESAAEQLERANILVTQAQREDKEDS